MCSFVQIRCNDNVFQICRRTWVASKSSCAMVNGSMRLSKRKLYLLTWEIHSTSGPGVSLSRRNTVSLFPVQRLKNHRLAIRLCTSYMQRTMSPSAAFLAKARTDQRPPGWRLKRLMTGVSVQDLESVRTKF